MKFLRINDHIINLAYLKVVHSDKNNNKIVIHIKDKFEIEIICGSEIIYQELLEKIWSSLMDI